MDKDIKSYWDYNPDDKKTWKYIDCKIYKNADRTVSSVVWIKNPDFRFKHLDPIKD